jgi:hypothetical protein
MSYDPKKDIGANIRFLQAILDNATSHVTQLDSQVNIIIGISSALFAFSASRLADKNSIVFLILGLFSALSAIAGLYSIHPPKFMRSVKKSEGKDSLLYHKNIMRFDKPIGYEKALSKIIGNQKSITHQYSIEIFMIYRNLYRPKRDLFNLSRNLLLAGISISLLIYIAINFLK